MPAKSYEPDVFNAECPARKALSDGVFAVAITLLVFSRRSAVR